MNALDTAIYSLMTADTGTDGVNNATTGATGGFHQLIAPQAATFPRIHWQEILDTAHYTFRNLSADHCYYQFTVFAVDSPTEEGVTCAGRLAERLRVLLTDPSMTVSGKTLLYSRFDRSIPARAELELSRFIYAKGFYLEMWLADEVGQLLAEPDQELLVDA